MKRSMTESASQVRVGSSTIYSTAHLVAVFSAPKYCDSTENKGAYIKIGPDYKLEFHKFGAVPHPNIKPMAYAAQSGLMGMT